jgi:3-keto-disaccharide hydrolase
MSRIVNTLSRALLLLIAGGSFSYPLGLLDKQAVQSAVQAGAASDEAGFEPIFDGKTLKGWEGDSRYWRVEGGSLVGEVTAETALKQNSFIIWRGDVPADFELKVSYRISERGNSGINYRSTEVAGASFALKGYQADIDGPLRNKGDLRHTGQNYEERGRTFLARRGEFARVEEGKPPTVVASLGEARELAAFIRNDDWNEYHLIARGNVLVHILNGHVMSVVVDEDAKARRMSGLIGVQVHVGPPMKVEYRNFRLKRLRAGS